ncbi:MAG: hypothetical protein ACK559_19655, partial [bacterium]
YQLLLEVVEEAKSDELNESIEQVERNEEEKEEEQSSRAEDKKENSQAQPLPSEIPIPVATNTSDMIPSDEQEKEIAETTKKLNDLNALVREQKTENYQLLLEVVEEAKSDELNESIEQVERNEEEKEEEQSSRAEDKKENSQA